MSTNEATLSQQERRVLNNELITALVDLRINHSIVTYYGAFASYHTAEIYHSDNTCIETTPYGGKRVSSLPFQK